MAAANDRLAPHQRVRGWSIWKDLDFPRTATGKVLRRAVAATVRSSSSSASVEAGPLDLLRRMAGPGASTDKRLGAELGLSSIDVAEIAAAIEERYQVELDPAAIHEDASLDQLLAGARSQAAHGERWPMPRWARRSFFRGLRGFLQTFLVFPVLRIFVRVEVRGLEHLEFVEPPFLLVANHASHFDVPVLLASMPRRLRRRIAVAMQPEYFEEYLLGRGSIWRRVEQGWHYNLLGLLLHTFPFPRSAAFRVARDYAGEMVDRGWAILVFPEGELSRGGAIQEFRPGLGVLARDLRLPVLPARIRGLFEVMPVGTWFPRGVRRPAGVAWGAPIKMMEGEGVGEFAHRVEADIRSR